MSDAHRLRPARHHNRWICPRMVRKSSTPSRRASRAGKGKDKGKPKDNVPTTSCPICGKAGDWKKDCWYNIPGGWEETNKPEDKSKGKDGKDKTSTNTQQQANKDKKSVKCWNCNDQGHVAKDCLKKKGSLSAVESQEQPSSSSGATGETTFSGFFLNALEEEAELNIFESKIEGVLTTGLDSGAARSVVPAGVIPGYPIERDSETGRVYTSPTGERVFDQRKQQILGTVDGKV